MATTTGTTAAGSRYTIGSNSSHAVTGFRPDGKGQFLSSWGARNVMPNDVIKVIEELEEAGWQNVAGFIEAF